MSSKKLMMKMARKWMKAAGIARKRISSTTSFDGVTSTSTSSSSCRYDTAPVKGHFAIYSNDGRRFMVPLKWLSTDIFAELLNLAEEEFGLPTEGPIVMPFDASSVEELYSILMRRTPSNDTKETLLLSLSDCRCSHSSSKIPPLSTDIPKDVQQLVF